MIQFKYFYTTETYTTKENLPNTDFSKIILVKLFLRIKIHI